MAKVNLKTRDILDNIATQQKRAPKVEENVSDYAGVFNSFIHLWQEAKLVDKQVVFWFDNPNGTQEPYYGNVIGVTSIENGNDVLLHLQVSAAGDMVFLPLSQAIGTRGFEIRMAPEEESEKKEN